MRPLHINRVGLALLGVLLVAAGCNQSATPPAPLPVEQIPSALQKAFSKAKPEVKDFANLIVSSVQAQDYSKAYLELQKLSSAPGLRQEQSSIAIRCTVTLGALLQSAEAKGDEKAAETLKVYRSTK